MSENQDRGQSRLKDFKNVNKGKDEWRQRRSVSSSEMRANKRENQMAKRRVAVNRFEVQPTQEVDLERLPFYIEQTKSTDADEVLEGVRSIRLLMCQKQDPPIKKVVSTGIHITLVNFLGNFDCPDLQTESAWVLTNIASGDKIDTQCVVEAAAIPALVALLRSPSDKVRNQATWGLGNIAGENVNYRDQVLAQGTMRLLLELLWKALEKLDNSSQHAIQGDGTQMDNEILQTGVWTISNLVRGNHSTPNYYEMIEGCVLFLARIINFSDDPVTLQDACWALSYLTAADANRIQRVVEAGVTSRLVKLMHKNEVKIVSPALRTIGNIVTGNDMQTAIVLKSDALEALDILLGHDAPHIRKEAAWTMSNILAGTAEHVKLVLEEVLDPESNTMVARHKIVARLLAIMSEDPAQKVRKEAAWAIVNLITTGAINEMNSVIMGYDALSAIMKFLQVDVVQWGQGPRGTKAAAMKSLEDLAYNMLSSLYQTVLPAGANAGYDYNIYAQRIKEVADTDVFEQIALQPSLGSGDDAPRYNIADLARSILADFFPKDDGLSGEYVNNNNEGVNAYGEMEFNPSSLGGGIHL